MEDSWIEVEGVQELYPQNYNNNCKGRWTEVERARTVTEDKRIEIENAGSVKEDWIEGCISLRSV